MSSLSNIPYNSRSLNGIIVLSDGVATITEGNITTTGDITGDNITTNSLSVGDITLNGSLEVPLVNDISVSTPLGSQSVSLDNKGKTYLEQDTYLNKAYSFNTPQTGYEICNKNYVDNLVASAGTKYTYITTNNYLLTFNDAGYIAVNDDGSISTIRLPQVTSSSQVGKSFSIFLKNGFPTQLQVLAYSSQLIIKDAFNNVTNVYFNKDNELVTLMTFMCINGANNPYWSIITYDKNLTFSNNIFYGKQDYFEELKLNLFSNLNCEAVGQAVIVSNGDFGTPTQSLNSYTNYDYPYSAITGWSFDNPAVAVRVIIGRGFTDWHNNYINFLPLSFQQYLCFYFINGNSTLNMTQNINFSETGTYILSFYTFGVYNRYSNQTTLTTSIGGKTTIAVTSESVWSRTELRFDISAVGTQTLTFTVNDTTDYGSQGYSAINLYGVQIRRGRGLNVKNTANTTDYQLIESKGIISSDFFNKGNFWQYGTTKVFGSLQVYSPYSSGSTIISNTAYGTLPTNTGVRNIIIGADAAVQATGLVNCVAISPGALEQSTSNCRDLIAIGYRSSRWNKSGTSNYFIGEGAAENLGYGVESGGNYNIGFGRGCISRGTGTNITNNVVIGHFSMGNYINGASNIQQNVIVGSSAFGSLSSSYNAGCGAGIANNMINTGSNYNSFLGYGAGSTIAGSSNVVQKCTFLGASSNIVSAGSYSNSTCIGYNSKITGDNQIILGTENEISYAMGGLVIPTNKKLVVNSSIEQNFENSSNSIAIGKDALSIVTQSTLSITDNIAIGVNAGKLLKNGSSNYFFGYNAGSTLTTPDGQLSNDYNIIFGQNTLQHSGTNISNNTIFGHNIMGGANTTASASQNCIFGNNSGYLQSGSNNCIFGYGSFIGLQNAQSNNNVVVGASSATSVYGYNSQIVVKNCTFVGSSTNTVLNQSYSNSTCIGYNSRISGDNQIILGTASEITYPMGGLEIPALKTLSLLGNLVANSLPITPEQVGFLSNVVTGQIPTSSILNYGVGYLLESVASATYQTIAGMSSYLTTAVASATYQTIAGMSSYLTTNTAQTISAVKTFSANPIFNDNGIETTKIDNIFTSVPYRTNIIGSNENTIGAGVTKINIYGYNNDISESDTNIIGNNNITTHTFSNIVGDSNAIYSGANSGTFGNNNVTNGATSFCVGYGNTINADNSSIFGNNNTCNATNVTIVGNGITMNSANRVVLGSGSQVVQVGGFLILNSQYINDTQGTPLTANITLPTTTYSLYSIKNTTAITITLQNANQTRLGNSITFRRVKDSDLTQDITFKQVSNASVMYDSNSVTGSTTTILPAYSSSITLSCLYNGSIYGWYVTALDIANIANNQYINKAQLLTFTSSAVQTIPVLSYRVYSVKHVATSPVIAMQPPSAEVVGQEIMFKRAPGSPATTDITIRTTTSGSHFLPTNSFTPQANMSILNGQYMSRAVCLFDSVNYYWYIL